MESKCIRCTPEAVRLPKRPRNSHKSHYGKLLILGGAVGYTGAVSLCARAAVCSGAGLVSVGVAAGCMALYPYAYVRYGVLAGILILAGFNYKKILNVIKQIAAMRK